MQTMQGITVVEVASWVFVPSAGAVLADWGADVVKIEHPVRGDPARGLLAAVDVDKPIPNYMVEQPNRGKRSIGVDISTDAGRNILYRLVERADVFLTSFLADTRHRLGIDVEHIRAVNPRIVYARGSGQGVRGAEANRAGFDSTSYWSRGSVGSMLSPPDSDWPIFPRPAFGDIMGGLALAGGISAALLARERTGEAPIVDVSLLGTALWQLSPDVVAAQFIDRIPSIVPDDAPNPLTVHYRTKDHRFIMLCMITSDVYWADFCQHIGRPELIDDPRFHDSAARNANRRDCISLLRETFAQHTLDEWRERLATMKGAWSPYQTPKEVHEDPQAIANGYLQAVPASTGQEISLVCSPTQFDEQPPTLRSAPGHGEHTDAVMTELGLEWDEIISLKVDGVLL